MHNNEEHGSVSQIREIQSGSGYNSQHMMRAHFGLGSSETVLDIRVRWPSGIVQNVTGISADQLIRVVEDENAFVFVLTKRSIASESR